MTNEKFVRRNLIIAQHLSEIALQREQIGTDGAALPFDPYFREVLSAQEHLLNALERLREQMPNRVVALRAA